MLAHRRFREFRGWLISSVWICVLGLFLVAPMSSDAQQASYSIQLQPGINSIANHLIDPTGGNRLYDILPNVDDGSVLYKFNPLTQTYDRADYYGGLGWVPAQPLAEFLNPGEGAFLDVPRSNVVTFVGTISPIQWPRLAASVFGGLNLVSAHEPRNMSFMELFGFPPAHGDVVYLYDLPAAALPNLDPAQGASSVHKFTAPQGWDSIAPLFKRGRSAFVRLSRAPRIMVHPKSSTANAGQTLRLDVTLLRTNDGPFSYQWQFNDDDIPGQTNSFLLFSNIQFLQSGLYTVTVRNFDGEATSKPASLRVISPPVILDPPRPMRAIRGQLVEFKVRAVGTPPLLYQWYRNNTELLPNATEPVLKVIATDSAQYQVRIMNQVSPNPTVSQPVTLEVNDPPRIDLQPVSQTVSPHDKVFFIVHATGTPPLSYQWTRNGVNIPNGTNPTLVIDDARPADSGFYQVKVGNIAGVAHSDLAGLNVDVPFVLLADRIQDSPTNSFPIYTARGDNLMASNEVDEVHCTRKGGSSVWLRWLAVARGIVRFETSGSSFDTVLAAYTMDASGKLTEVACDDDEGEFLGSRIRFTTVPNTIYFIAIDGVEGARGRILLDWELRPTAESLPIIIQHPHDQTARPDDSVTFLVEARSTSGAPLRYQWFHNGEELFNQMAPLLRIAPVTEESLGYYYVEVFEDGQSIRSRRALLQMSLADANNRLVQGFAVDKFADALNRTAAGPGNLFSVATTSFSPVFGYTGTQIFSTVGFTGEPGELSHCGIPGGSSAWFSFVPEANGQLFLDTAGSSFNTVLAVYTGPGPTIASLTANVCDNDSGPGTTSALNFPAIKDTTYYIALDGYNGVTGTAHLNYRLLVPMTLSRVLKTNDTDCRFRITGTPSYPLTIQRCSGFQTWSPVITVTNPASGIYDYRDTNATIVRRFYRAIQTP